MTAHRKLQIKDLPDWPRRMSKPIAAAYCGVSENTLMAMVGRGELPTPLRIGGRILWDKAAIDAMFDRQSGLDHKLGEWNIPS